MQHSWICWNKITGWNWEFFSRGGTHSLQRYFSKLKILYLIQFLWYRQKFFTFQLLLMCSFEHIIKKTCILETSKVAKNMTSSLWSQTFDIYWHFSCKNNWQFVFFSFAKFGVERVNTFEVRRKNVKYPRNHETFGGWFGAYAFPCTPVTHFSKKRKIHYISMHSCNSI